MSEAQWNFWLASMRGERPETTPGHPHSGFYRDRSSRAVAIWYEGDVCRCEVTSGFRPRSIDEIDQVFSFVCRAPISRDLFMQIRDGGTWPEHVDMPEARGIGDNSAGEVPPEEIIADQIEQLKTSAQQFIKDCGGSIASMDHANRGASFYERFYELELEAERTRVKLKKPHDDAADAVQKTWKPLVDNAKALKKWMDDEIGKFRRAEEKRRADAAAKVDIASAVEPVPVRIIGSAGRAHANRQPRKELIIDDLGAYLGFFKADERTWKNPDVLRAIGKIAEMDLKSGRNVPGARYAAKEEQAA
jgi:hypothetical protein